MKIFNKFCLLLLVGLFSFQACQQESLIQTEVDTFKSIDELPTDDRFVDLVLESINLSAKANPAQLERAQELINQENRSVEDQAEIAAIMGYENWDAFMTYAQNQQELIKALNAEYNLETYEAEEIKEYTTQVYDYVMENKAVARDDLIGGPVAVGGVGGGIDPCIDACNRGLALCLLGNGIAHVIWSVGCMFSTDPALCHIVNIIGSVVVTYNCFVEHTACVDAC